MIRPATVRICGPGYAATLLAMVRDLAYRGRRHEYVVELGNRVELTGILDARRPQHGERCAIQLDPAGESGS